MELFILWIIAWPILSIAAGIYAQRINRSATGWCLFALILSPLLAFVLLLALGPRETEDEDDLDRVRCPYCAEEIRPEAVVCPHCRRDLVAAERRAARLLPRNRER
jgi:hypothetical protein